MKLTLACLLVLTLIAGAACNQTAEVPPGSHLPPANGEEAEATTTSTPPPTTPAEEEAETPPPATITEEDIEAARQVVLAYFEALNNYDLEAALACMEESWGNEKGPGLASEISQMKTWSVSLTVEEEAEPTVTADDRVELHIKIDVSTFGQPDRHAVYQLMEIEGKWKICYSEDAG